VAGLKQQHHVDSELPTDVVNDLKPPISIFDAPQRQFWASNQVVCLTLILSNFSSNYQSDHDVGWAHPQI